MLQTSKTLLHQIKDDKDQNYNTDNIEGQTHVDMIGGALNDHINTDSNHIDDKNPILNKRILLKVNYEQLNNVESDVGPVDIEQTETNNINFKNDVKQSIFDVRQNEKDSDDFTYGKASNENGIFDKMKLIKPLASNNDDIQNHGRIVIYGDSNCLDSTHMEKPCFWLLDALLEFTMSSYVSNVLKDLNRSPNIQFTTNSMSIFPKRLPNNHLHLYSKVLMPSGASSSSSIPLKRPIPKCNKLWWDTPIFLNISASNDFHGSNKDDRENINTASELNLRRKLESQKGEVRRC